MTRRVFLPITVKALFDSHPLPMWVYDPETLAFLAVNDAALKQYGYSRREFLAMTIPELHPPEDLPALPARVAAIPEGYDPSGTWQHRKKDGTIIEVEIISHSIRFARRKARLVFANVVTGRRGLEQDLARALDELQLIFDAMGDAVALIDPEGRITRCNKVMADLVGEDCRRIPGRRCWELVHGATAPATGCPVQEMLTTRRRATATMPHGSRIIRVVADPLFDASGRLLGAVHIVSDVTRQEEEARALHEMAARQEAILDNIPDIAWLKDEESRFIAVNAPFGRACGRTPAELVGKTDLDIWPRELAEHYRADDREVMTSRRRKVIEEPISDLTGTVEWLETIKTPIFDKQGHVIGTAGIARDITARRRAEEALRVSEEKFRVLFESANDGIYILDESGRFLDANLRACERLGYTRAELLSKHITELDTPEFAARVPERIEQVLRTGQAVFESANIRKDGTVMPIEVSSRLVDIGGRHFFYAIIRDISERKRAEEEIHAQKAFTENLLQNSSIATFVLNERHEVVIWNRACEQLTGTPAADVLGTTRAWGAFYPEERPVLADLVLDADRERAAELYHHFSPSALIPEGWHAERWIENLNGRRRYVVFDAAPVRDRTGKVVAAVETLADNSAQKFAEEAILSERNRANLYLDIAGVMLCVLDTQGKISLINPRGCGLLGYERDEIVGRNWFALVVPARIRAEIRRVFDRLMSGDVAPVEYYENPVLRKDGEERTVAFHNTVVREDGRIVGVLFSGEDVTERKAADEALRERMRLAEFERDIGNALNSGKEIGEILLACAEAMVKQLGAAFARIWTLSPDGGFLELRASAGMYRHLDGAHSRIPIEAGLKIPTIARTRTPNLTNAVLDDPQVDRAWAAREGMRAFAGYPLVVADRMVGVVGMFSKNLLSDFVQRALAAAAVNIALGIQRSEDQEALRRYGARLAALAAASNHLMQLESVQEIHEEICRSVREIIEVDLVWLGLARAEGKIEIAAHAGRSEYLSGIEVTWDETPAGRGPTGTAVRTGQPCLGSPDTPAFQPWSERAATMGFQSSLAVPLVSGTGSRVCAGALNLYSRYPRYFDADRIRLCQLFANQAAIAIENARLVTGLEEKVLERTRNIEDANLELHKVNQELDLRRSEADTANRAKSEFLANMSHELRTPLNSILGFSEILRDRLVGEVSERQREYLNDIWESGRHLLRLINDILDISKVEAGKMDLELREVDLKALLSESLTFFREKARQHSISLHGELAPELPAIEADARLIKQVLVNLLGNAVKFTPDGGEVGVCAVRVGPEVQVSVWDTGIGIAAEDLGRLFEPFHQLESALTKKYEGTGLGLSLCRKLVELHGGRIWVESTPGQGSRFTFSLPLAAAAKPSGE